MAMDVERLIERVKSHIFLYDIGHKDYKNTTRKAGVWEKIATELNENSETVKLKWKTVRDGYIKFKKQQKEGNNKKVVNYIWSTQLKFLDDYQVSRKTKKAEAIAALQLSEEDDDETPSRTCSPASILIPSPSASGPFRSDTVTTTRRKKRISEKSVSLVPKDKKTKIEREHYDATDHLFLSYSQTFKTFSRKQQALLKLELAKLFSNAELNALQDAENLQESLVAGSDGYPLGKNEFEPIVSLDIHTVDDEDSDDDIELVPPTKARRRQNSSDGTI